VSGTEELRRLAEAATPGPWVDCGDGAVRQPSEGVGWHAEAYLPADAAYIAAANPAVILALLDRVDSLTAENERLRAGQVTYEMMGEALQTAWDDYTTDTGCYPDDFTVTGGRSGHTLSADFRSNFVRSAAEWLSIALARSAGGDPR
jgi:hypothetical protein